MEAEAIIIESLDYDIAFTETVYHHLARIVKDDREKLEESEKLLSLVMGVKEVQKSGNELFALAIVYLIKPSQLREFPNPTLQRIKVLAGKVYNIYITVKTAIKNQPLKSWCFILLQGLLCSIESRIIGIWV